MPIPLFIASGLTGARFGESLRRVSYFGMCFAWTRLPTNSIPS